MIVSLASDAGQRCPTSKGHRRAADPPAAVRAGRRRRRVSPPDGRAGGARGGRDRGLLLLARAGAYALAGLAIAALMTACRSRWACRCWRRAGAGPGRRRRRARRRREPARRCAVGDHGGRRRRARAQPGGGRVGALILAFVVTPLIASHQRDRPGIHAVRRGGGAGRCSTMARRSRGPQPRSVLVGLDGAADRCAIVAERRRDLA